IDFETLEGAEMSIELALATMRGRPGLYDPAIVAALCELHGEAGGRTEVRELPLARLRAGMVLAEQVRTKTGNVLCASGNMITATLLERLHSCSKRVGLREPFRVVVKARIAEAKAS